MKIKSKAILAALCAVLLVAATAFGTLAYLKASTTEVKNTFTAGTLATLDLKEHKATADTDGVYTLGTDLVTTNTYKVIPGINIPKDPFVKVTGVDVPAYLFIEVVGLDKAPFVKTVDGETASGDINASVNTSWKKTDITGPNGGVVYIYGTDGVVTTDITAAYILTGDTANAGGVVNVASGFDPSTLGTTGVNLSFYAYLCQKSGFDTAAAAWDANFKPAATE